MDANTIAKTSLSAVVQELGTLRGRRATGTYYVVSDDNRQARICLMDGEIVSVVCHLAEGQNAPDAMDAMDALAAMRISRTRFAPNITHATDSKVGALGAHDADDAYQKLRQRAGIQAEPGATQPRGSHVAGLSAAEHQLIRQTLVNYLGPIADFVYEEHCRADPSVESLLTQLSAEIPDRRQAAEFLARVRQQLQRSPE